MTKEELREWLGLRFADLLIYLAAAAIIVMYLIHAPVVEILLAVAALALAVAACPFGMKSSPNVSPLTNVIKKIVYPVAIPMALFFISLNYVGYFQIPQNGMYPELPAGSRILTLRRPCREASQVARGDIVVFARTANGVQYKFIWRVIGLPGETVQTSKDAVILNGHELSREMSHSDGDMDIYQETNGNAVYAVAYERTPRKKSLPDTTVTIPEGHFFVMGDNRHNAQDSRYLGTIPFESIVAKKW